jgi:hypothetical protein
VAVLQALPAQCFTETDLAGLCRLLPIALRGDRAERNWVLEQPALRYARNLEYHGFNKKRPTNARRFRQTEDRWRTKVCGRV